MPPLAHRLVFALLRPEPRLEERILVELRGPEVPSVIGYWRYLRKKFRLIGVLNGYLREPYYRFLEIVWRDGVYINFPSGDRFRIHPRFLGMNLSNYEPELIGTFCKLVHEGMTVVDVGAHIGIYSLIASRRVGRKGKVIAIEASPANATLLRRHLKINQCTNVEVIEAAIGDRTGDITFIYRPNATDPVAFANSLAYDISGRRANIPMMKLDDICHLVSPGLVKVDIEGAELLAMRGASGLLTSCRPTVIVAVHPEPLRMLGASPKELVDYMRTKGYSATALDGRFVDDAGAEELIFLPES